MDSILLGPQHERCLVYKDDIIIYSPTIYDHISWLSEVLRRLRKANLRKVFAYLGYLITKYGVKPPCESGMYSKFSRAQVSLGNKIISWTCWLL